MSTLSDHLASISLLPASSTVFLLVLGGDMLLTVAHTVQEVRARMWRYFGAIAGMRFPDPLGIVIFAGFIGGMFWGSSFAGIAGAIPVIGPVSIDISMGAIGLTITARLSDAWYSHMELDRRGFRPNPGLSTAGLYLLEGVLLPIVFFPGLRAHPAPAAIGAAIGWVTFVTVPFNFRAVRALLPKSHAPVWRAGEPIPEWGR
ncbi:MAG: hypothetical protein HY560_07650 [Gemmatimonadetes bacterium]|nr:hypothetical protein [Gemmatimonadota bacterium]